MNCLFCKIIEKKTKEEIVCENDGAIAMLDISPASKGHVIIITKKHFNNFVELDEEHNRWVFLLAKKIVEKIKKCFSPSGFNFISNMGTVAYQSIFHFHLHAIPKYEKEKGFIWKENSGEQSLPNLKDLRKKIKDA